MVCLVVEKREGVITTSPEARVPRSGPHTTYLNESESSDERSSLGSVGHHRA